MDSNKEPQLVEHDFEFYIFALTAASTFLKWNIAHSFSYVGKLQLQKNTMCYYKVTNKRQKLGPGHTSTISIETLSIDMDFKYRQ